MRRLIAVFLALFITMSLVPPSLCESAFVNATSKKEDTYFCYASDERYVAKYYYDDEYFSGSAYEYNPSLSTMTLCMAMAGTDVSGDDYVDGDRNIKNLMTDIGMDMYEANEWFGKKPQTDSIGVVCGAKKIDDYTLVAIVVRGGGYGAEWSSNFYVGESGDHKGFTQAKDDALKFANSFITDNGIEGKVKFWVTGFSRGAATANMIGAALDDDFIFDNDVEYGLDDVYTYTFETPAGLCGITDEKYDNIFNIVNPNDIVTMVAPAAFGFRRYGVDVYLPSSETSSDYYELRKRMLNIFETMPGYYDYEIDNFASKRLSFSLGSVMDSLSISSIGFGGGSSNIVDTSVFSMENMIADTNYATSQSMFFRNFMDRFATDFGGSRDNYVDKYEESFRFLFDMMLGSIGEDNESFKDSLQNEMANFFVKYLMERYSTSGPLGSISIGDSSEEILAGIIREYLDKCGVDSYDDEDINELSSVMLELLEYMLFENPNDFATLIGNTVGLTQAHDPEICYSWLASMDSNYYYGVLNHTNNGDYRIVRISGSLEVNVYDANSNKVASIYDRTRTSVNGSAYTYGLNNGVKIFVLPVDMDYHIDLSLLEDSSIEIGISEYSTAYSKITRVEKIYYSNASSGDVLTLNLPSYTEEDMNDRSDKGSSVEYTLECPSGVPNTTSFRADNVEKTYRSINVTASGSGLVSGSGDYQIGEHVILEAHSLFGAFDGWYQGDSLYSSDQILNINVSENLDLIAKFSISLTKCSHTSVNIIGYVNPKCGEEGYSGDLICDKCGQNLNDEFRNEPYSSIVLNLTGSNKLNAPGKDFASLSHNFDSGMCSKCQELETGYIPFENVELFDIERYVLDTLLEEPDIKEGETPVSEVKPSDSLKIPPTKKKTDNSKWIWIGVIGGGVLVCTAGVFFVLKYHKRRKSENGDKK